ncbi:hypothetical protein EDB92DRAFT_1821947 [Lactarius akahatsu]|uniref:C2 domain-containing protein n=1 Tax=Lactarius akahatsu TaxID=416441 RepID=A0AAD4Q7D7_9AGAM|nr:hypothetical protein EDB92DRAFT_1821947 [Lactarius akahatsu]
MSAIAHIVPVTLRNWQYCIVALRWSASPAMLRSVICAIRPAERKAGLAAGNSGARHVEEREMIAAIKLGRGVERAKKHLVFADKLQSNRLDLRSWFGLRVEGQSGLADAWGVARLSTRANNTPNLDLDNRGTIRDACDAAWSPRRSNQATHPQPRSSVYSTYETLSEMEHRQIISNLPSMGSTQIAESQGSQSQPISVGVTVIRARNIPHIKTTFGRKRELFVTIAYGATTKKTKKQTEKRTKTVHIDGQTAVWDQRLDPLYDFLLFSRIFRLKVPISFVQPSSQLTLCLYAKRLTQRDILIGIHQMVIPNESESSSSIHYKILAHTTKEISHM